jgi:hypothetical protein
MLQERIISLINEIAESADQVVVANLSESTVLLESGLDSLGFAVLVARLEEELGYDPFVLMEEPVYPRTLGDFVAIYDRFRQQ